MKDIGHQSSTPIVVARLIARVRGGSQAAIVQCEDGRFYILKFNGSPQGPNVLANEFLGSRLGQAIGLPLAETRFILVKHQFLDAHPSVVFTTRTSTYKPDPGVHLGTLLVGEPAGDGRALEWIASSAVKQIANISDFLGMYLFDVWSMHEDRRQAVFVAHRGSRKLYGTFVDSGHLFGGPNWEYTGRKFIACHFLKMLYSGLWSDKDVQAWTRTLQRTMPRELLPAAAMIPPDWYSGDLTALCNRLLARLSELPSLFKEHSLDEYLTHRKSTPVCDRVIDPGAVDTHARFAPNK